MADFNGKTLVLISVGGIVFLSGVRGNSVSSTIRSFITGHGPSGGDFTNPVTATATDVPSFDVNTPGDANPLPASSNAAANRAAGQMMALQYGWVGAEWTALDKLWLRESGWRNTADNPESHAYGIPQALPADKLPKSGQPASLGGKSNPIAQIAWGLSYIRTRYGSPSNAYAHELSSGWY